MSESGLDPNAGRKAADSEHDQAAQLLLLDAFCQQAYRNARRSKELLQPLEGGIADSRSALTRRDDVDRLCEQAELWVRDRYDEQRVDAAIARRLACLEERKENRLKNLISAISQVRRIVRGEY